MKIPTSILVTGMLLAASVASARTPQEQQDAPVVTQPRVISRVEAQLTEEARTAGIEFFVVVLEVSIDRDGIPDVLGVVSDPGYGVAESASEALRQWRFQPATRNGEPVDVKMNVEYNVHVRDTESPD